MDGCEILDEVAVGFAGGLDSEGQGKVEFMVFETLGFNHRDGGPLWTLEVL